MSSLQLGTQSQFDLNQVSPASVLDSRSLNQGRFHAIIYNESIQNQDFMHFNARFKLPKLQAPAFYGSFDTWLTFHDFFKSMCNNPTISPIQKFHYLKAWDMLSIFISRKKLNNYTREKWKVSVGSTALPSLKDMISFFERL